jgi:Phytanoyl-CoA dioxygenase (PhyH)
MDVIRTKLERDGFLVIPGVWDEDQMKAMLHGLTAVLQPDQEATSIRSRDGTVYAARNLLTLWPDCASVWRQASLLDLLGSVLGPRFGLVRVLFFDKPPERTWTLPWHKDLTIAVRDNQLPSEQFRKPTTKVGVPHVEAPIALLENMLTVRIHLDPMTAENGPLKLLPGSHHTGKTLRLDLARSHTLHVERGDVLLVRPLVAHCSSASHPDTRLHRRVLHLEFAGPPELPDGYAWHTFLPGFPGVSR